MQLMRRREAWDPFREMEELSNRFGRLFGVTRPVEGEDEGTSASMIQWAPSCDIVETEQEYRVRAELPDVKKEDVHITLDAGILTIQGERRSEAEEKNARFHRRELSYGSFLRRFVMPDDADDANVDASFKDGMLTVVLKKSEHKPSPAKEIAVH